MEPSTVAPAPGQSDTITAPPPPVPADVAAVQSKNFSDFQEAKAAERVGKPMAPKAVEKATEPPTPKGPSKKDIEADERIRARVAEAVALKDREIADLRAKVAPPTEPAKQPEQPKRERFMSLEDFSKANPTATFEDYQEARDDWRDTQKERASRERAAVESLTRDLTERGKTFDQRMRSAVEKEPDLATKIPPAMAQAQGLDALPFSALSPSQQANAKFTNIVAEAAFRSEHPAELLKHLHAHPEDVERAGSQRSAVDALYVLAEINGRIGATSTTATGPTTPPAASAVSPSTVANLPPPPPTLNKPGSRVDPADAAFKRNDFASWQAIRVSERLAEMKGRTA